MSEKRTCSKSKGCKTVKCIHHKEHVETSFCDELCDTHPDAECIKVGETMDEEDIRQRRETEKRKQERKANEEKKGKKIVKVLQDGKQVLEIQK